MPLFEVPYGVCCFMTKFQYRGKIKTVAVSFLASPDAQEVIVVSQSLSESVTESELADLTDVTLVSGTWVTHDHLSSVIESNL